MSDTIRERIISAIITKLANVRTANGYNTDCGRYVQRAVKKRDSNKVQSLIVWPGVEEAERKYQKITCIMPVKIDGEKSFTQAQNPSEVAEQILGDIIEVMTGIAWTLAYSSGGTYTPQPGDTITGEISGATARIAGVTLSSGTFGAGSASGSFSLLRKSGTFESETLAIGANSDIATITGDATGQDGATTTTGGLADSIEYAQGGVEEYPEISDGIIGVSALFNVKYQFLSGNPYSQ
uniref:Putative tail protein n=1 Tax=viral metagenome TaxID=1070528 RepID=A0A6M3J4K9_9ZZZZ